MQNKDEIKAPAASVAKSYTADLSGESLSLEGIIKDGGYDNGRLFHSADKATYTFLNGDELISLHFDMQKQVLYLKGHKIICLDDHPELPDFLARFKKALLSQASAHKFLALFDAVVSRICRI